MKTIVLGRGGRLRAGLSSVGGGESNDRWVSGERRV